MRQRIYEALTASVELAVIVGDRIMSTYDEVPQTPFLVIRGGPSRDTNVPASQSYWHIWVHDAPGDFGNIDDALDIVKDVLEAMPNADDLFSVSWVETTADLPVDPVTNTIARYSRFLSTNRR